MTPQEQTELGRLIALLADGSIAPAELEVLEAMLRDNTEARALYQRYVALDVDLSWNFAETPGPAFDPEEVTRVVTARRRQTRRRLGLVAVVSGLAAALLLVILFTKHAPEIPEPTRSPDGIAHLLEQAGDNEVVAVDGSVQPAGQVRALHSGATVRTGSGDSFLVLEFVDGTKLQVSADSIVHLSEAKGKQVFVERGAVHADVVKQPAGQPLVLTTPHAVVEVVGTRFLASAASESTRVDMEAGSVEMTRRVDGRKIEVSAGRFAIADRNVDAQPFAPKPLSPRVQKSRVLTGALPGPIMAIDLSRDDRRVAVGNWDGSVLEWDLDADQPTKLFQAHGRKIRTIAYAPDGKLLATGSDDKTVRVLDAATGKDALPPLKLRLEVDDVLFSPDGRWLAVTPAFTGGQGGLPVRLYDTRTGMLVRTLPIPVDRATRLAFAPDSSLLAVGGIDRMVRVWMVESGELQALLPGSAERISALAFAPNGQVLATASRDSVQLWDTTRWQLRRAIARPFFDFKAIAFTPDGNYLACAGLGLVRVWNVETGDERLTFAGHRYLVTDVHITRDGMTMITSGWDHSLRVWDLSVLEP